jgi:hypothetical protein
LAGVLADRRISSCAWDDRLRQPAFRLIGTLLLLVAAALGPVAPVYGTDCAFVLGFAAMYALIPAVSGPCAEDEHYDPLTGDALQATTHGLLVWRKADNWTAFTDGYHTWINGPDGLQERLNTQRFSWEASPDLPAMAVQNGGWLARLNEYRAAAGLPSVSEDVTLEPGASHHARYIVETGIVDHTEDPSSPWYSLDGATAARSSDLIGFAQPASESQTIDGLIAGPFHALPMLDPALRLVGYASYREGGHQLQLGASLAFGAGWGVASATSPIMWPANGSTFPLRALVQEEIPSPLTSCPGYIWPAGFPIMLILGRSGPTPEVSNHSLTADGAPIAHCVFDATSYVNPNRTEQSVGRAILGGSNAIVVLPRDPLVAASAYHVTITTNSQTYAWSFTAGP